MTTLPSEYSIENICIQKNRRALLNVPPTRFTPISPYPQYTKFQLDMRRKAEILKYKNNTSNTKTNNFTKAQKFSQIVNGVSYQQFSNQTLQDISNGLISCNINKSIPTPTSSCDVPGPVILLYEDPSIPLYNYATNTRSYGIINSIENALWTTYTNNDLYFFQNILTELFTLYIHNNINNNYYTFTIELPVSIFINAISITSNIQTSISISNVYIYVYYNSTLISSNDPNTTPTITTSPIITNDFIPLSLNVSNSKSFGAVFFCGILNISNLLLFTQPGFIYDIKLNFSLTISSNSFSNLEYGAVCNVSTNNNTIYNCSLLTPPSNDTNNGFVFYSE